MLSLQMIHYLSSQTLVLDQRLGRQGIVRETPAPEEKTISLSLLPRADGLWLASPLIQPLPKIRKGN